MRVLALLDGTLADPDVAADPRRRPRSHARRRRVRNDPRRRREAPRTRRRTSTGSTGPRPCSTCRRPPRAEFERAVELVIGNWTGGARDRAEARLHPRRRGRRRHRRPVSRSAWRSARRCSSSAREGLSAVTLDRGIEPDLADRAPWLLLGAKSLSYAINMAALREAERRGAAEVIFTTSDGSVLEGPTSTVILVRGRTLVTPPSKLGILPGTTQYALFRAAERAGWTVERRADPDRRALRRRGRVPRVQRPQDHAGAHAGRQAAARLLSPAHRTPGPLRVRVLKVRRALSFTSGGRKRPSSFTEGRWRRRSSGCRCVSPDISQTIAPSRPLLT